MIDFLKKIKKIKTKTLNTISINRDSLLMNLSYIKSLQPSSEIFPVLKSNAYGHGLEQVCEVLKETNINMVCIDSFIEYQYVVKYFKKNVLVLGETNPENYLRYNIRKTSFCVYNLSTLIELKKLKKKFKIHLFLNTGMNREGISRKDLNKFLEELKKSKIRLEGVCSHFSSADDILPTESINQIARFKNMFKIIQESGFDPKYKHIAASSGIIKIKDVFFNACRPGIIFYGYNPINKYDKFFTLGNKVKPVLELKSTLVAINEINKGEGVSYNLTYKSNKDGIIATVPFGYYEGLDRKLSNSFEARYRNHYLPQRGRICMNYSCFEIGDLHIKVGDQINLISSNPDFRNSVKNIATQLDTIEYEILVRLNENIRREVV